MGEDAFEETRLVSDRGTIILRGGYGRREVWLGVSRRMNDDDDPDIVVRMSPRMVLRLIAGLAEMSLAGDEDDASWDGHEPGEPIGTSSCPCCGASLEISHGDEPGQIAIVGEPKTSGANEIRRLIAERNRLRGAVEAVRLSCWNMRRNANLDDVPEAEEVLSEIETQIAIVGEPLTEEE